ncbi:hypothetical protein [Acidicapsa acidisoli]|uniref:hypothetical protein n=1 Tax=Acidicapsa acidisoli TaxID=1615681 RepID=UPI0021E03F20|nr:hypothetical protein [Acidicapsa acidisoli]
MKAGRPGCPVQVFGLWLLLSCFRSAAPQESPSQDTPFKIEVNVNRVLVQVVARDAQGQVVRDLK